MIILWYGLWAGHRFRAASIPISLGVALLGTGWFTQLGAQAALVDKGSFEISLQGLRAGTEEFEIRRAGDMYIATGKVDAELDGLRQSITTLLSAAAPDGESQGYELSVSGRGDAFTVRLNVATPRFISVYESDVERESREFPGGAGTRILEEWVAHHYFFVGSLSVGQSIPIVVPGERYSGRLTVKSAETVESDSTSSTGTRLTVEGPRGEGFVWFDVRGRVFRVEIPGLDYVAVREEGGHG